MIKDHENIKEKLNSKLWKIRLQGFKELSDFLENTPTFLISLREWAKYLTDSHLQSQELIFLVFKSLCQRNSIVFEKEEGFESLIKGLLSGGTKEIIIIGMDCFEELFRKNTKELLIAVNKILVSKSNNQINVLLDFIIELVIQYGPHKSGFETIIDNIIILLKESTIKIHVKTKIMSIFKEAYYYWGKGEETEKLLLKMKKPFSYEFEEFIKNNPISELKSPLKTIDLEIEIKEEKNNIGKLIYNDNWIKQILDQKKTWQIKKEMLEEFLLNLPNLQKNDLESIVSPLNIMLKRLLNENNPNIVILAIKIIEKIFNHFSKEAFQFTKVMLLNLIEKFKDKKTNVVEETHKALNSLRKNINIEENAMQTIFLETLESKNPNIRVNSLIFLNRIASNSNIEYIIPFFKKVLDDPNQEIRDIAITNLKDFYHNYKEKVQPVINDLPKAKLLHIMSESFESENYNDNNNKTNNNTNNNNNNNNNTLVISSFVKNNSEENFLLSRNNNDIQSELIEIEEKFTPSEIFCVQELDFLRMSKKMRVFQTESKKIAETDSKANFELLKMQFTQVFTRSFREKLLAFNDKKIFMEALVELYSTINYFLEGNSKEGKSYKEALMKYETVSDLLIKSSFFFYKSLISSDNICFQCCLMIIKILKGLVKVLIQLKQNFLDFEVKILLNLSVLSFSCEILKNNEKIEGEIFQMLENLTFLTLNSNKMPDFFLEEFRKSDAKKWFFRDEIIKLCSDVLIPKLSHFPLVLLQDFWEIISNRKIITTYKHKYSNFSPFSTQFSNDFFEILLLKPVLSSDISESNFLSFFDYTIKNDTFNDTIHNNDGSIINNSFKAFVLGIYKKLYYNQ